MCGFVRYSGRCAVAQQDVGAGATRPRPEKSNPGSWVIRPSVKCIFVSPDPTIGRFGLGTSWFSDSEMDEVDEGQDIELDLTIFAMSIMSRKSHTSEL